MKNRITVRHGMLGDLESYLEKSGWKIENPIGDFEVLRARRVVILARCLSTIERQADADTASMRGI